MKPFMLTLLCFIIIGRGYAQVPVTDEHPRAQIYVIDPASGEEVPATSDLAIQFKNSLIDLVRNTSTAKQILARVASVMTNRVFTITQMGVETNIDGYQLILEQLEPHQSQNITIYTFAYHVDNNTLYFYDPATQNWNQERISPDNSFNLRKTATYAQRFNQQLANQPIADANGQLGADASADLTQAVDADVAAENPPPPMPEYEQPECPNEDFLWQPGYWAFSPMRTDYYWVPGAWVAPPTPGVLWTPPYWGYEGSRYIFHIGYWGDHIGFYGGINYGYGYGGHGYYGGEWHGGHFRYNTAVVRVNVRVVHNTYVNRTVISTTVVKDRHSFNGHGGIMVSPSREEVEASHEHHLKPTPEQNGHQLQARGNPNQFTKNSGGWKPIYASAKAEQYHPQGNGGNRGRNPANGGQPNKPGQQGVNARPGIQGTNPDRPNVHGNGNRKPNVQGTNPGQPQVEGTNSGKPGIQGTSPDQQQVQGANQGRPTQHGDGNRKPNVQVANPGLQQGQGVNPGQPGGQKANPGQPQVQGSNPDKPKADGANPGQPGIQGTNPPKPQVQKPVQEKPQQVQRPVQEKPQVQRPVQERPQQQTNRPAKQPENKPAPGNQPKKQHQ